MDTTSKTNTQQLISQIREQCNCVGGVSRDIRDKIIWQMVETEMADNMPLQNCLLSDLEWINNLLWQIIKVLKEANESL